MFRSNFGNPILRGLTKHGYDDTWVGWAPRTWMVQWLAIGSPTFILAMKFGHLEKEQPDPLGTY